MLNPRAGAPASNPDGRRAPKVSLDGRTQWCRTGTSGNRGRLRRKPASWGCSELVARAILPTKREQIGCLSGECRNETAGVHSAARRGRVGGRSTRGAAEKASAHWLLG